MITVVQKVNQKGWTAGPAGLLLFRGANSFPKYPDFPPAIIQNRLPESFIYIRGGIHEEDTRDSVDTVRGLTGVLVGQVQGADIVDFLRIRTGTDVLVGNCDTDLLVARLEKAINFD